MLTGFWVHSIGMTSHQRSSWQQKVLIELRRFGKLDHIVVYQWDEESDENLFMQDAGRRGLMCAWQDARENGY